MFVQEIAAFLTYSLVWLPLTGLFIWALFLVLKHTRLPRPMVLLVSCIIVAVSLHFLESVRTFDKADVYELLDIGIWLIVGLAGLFFRGKGERAFRK